MTTTTPDRGRVLALMLAGALTLAACSGSSAPSATSAPAESSGPSTGLASEAAVSPAISESGTLEVWLGGILTTATPGTPYRQWVDDITARLIKAHPGWTVNISLLPANNDQLAAQVQAAFTSKKTPDVMMLYGGSYTSAYDDGLLQLEPLIDATPGFRDQMTLWDWACSGLNCASSERTIGVPVDQYTFVMWYRKDLFEKAGVPLPPSDAKGAPWAWNDFLASCAKFKAAGVTAMVYGDRDGYTTSNMLTTNLVSYFEPGDQDKLLSGELSFTDPKFVAALSALQDLKQNGCVPEDASTREQLDAANDLVTGEVAMMEGQPQFLPYFKDIRDKLGVTLIPMSGSGPFKANTASMAGDTWSIPKDSQNGAMAWEFIKLASDETAGEAMIGQLGSPPANVAAAGKINDPEVQFVLNAIQNAKIGVLDTVMSQATALVWYREVQQAFSGQKSAEDALKAIDDFNQSQTGP